MKSTLAILLIIVLTATLNASALRRLQDTTSCLSDITEEYNNLKEAITNKNWNSVSDFVVSLSKVFSDCLDSENQGERCLSEISVTYSNVYDLFTLFKNKDINPSHYINNIEGLVSDFKAVTTECNFTQSTNKLRFRASIPKDAETCYADLKNLYTEVKTAIDSGDIASFTQALGDMNTTFNDCKEFYDDVTHCVIPAYDLVKQVVNLVKYATERSLNPINYYDSIKTGVTDVENVIEYCFKQ